MTVSSEICQSQHISNICPDKSKAKEKDNKADDPKAGADTGKIVNLMSGDCTRVSL